MAKPIVPARPPVHARTLDYNYGRIAQRSTPDGYDREAFNSMKPVAKASHPPTTKGAVATIHRTVVRGGR